MPAAMQMRAQGKSAPKPEPKILHQAFFKSVGTRTYAAQVKEAGNGNHFILLTEGKRDEKTGELRKTRLIVFSEDFPEFFKLLDQTHRFTQSHPVPESVARRASEKSGPRKRENNSRKAYSRNSNCACLWAAASTRRHPIHPKRALRPAKRVPPSHIRTTQNFVLVIDFQSLLLNTFSG